MFATIKPLSALNEISAYSDAMEKYVASKEFRIIEVIPTVIDGRTYYKCPELEYYYFSDIMFSSTFAIANLSTIKKEIQYLLSNSEQAINYYDDNPNALYHEGVQDGYETALKEVLDLFKNI